MFVLSNSQKLIYDMEKYAGGSIAVICGSVLVEGNRDRTELQKAANEILRCNEALRTRIVQKGSQVLQEVLDFKMQNIEILHFDSKEALDAYAEMYAKEPIPLEGTLCTLRVVVLPGHYGLLAKCHHIVGDAWTLTLIASQFNAFLAGQQPKIYPYSKYVESEIAYIQGKHDEKDRAFFLEQFKACDEVTYLSDKKGNSFVSYRETFLIGAERTAQIRKYAKMNNTSPFVLFLMAFSIYFSRVKMNTEQFYIGTPILNRGSVREKHTMGMFINTVPVLANVNYEQSFAENLKVMLQTVFSILRHQKFHYNDVLAAIRQEYGFTEKLYDVILSYQNAAVTGVGQGVTTTWYHNGTQTESLQIHIDDRDREGTFRIHLDYRADKLTRQEVQRMYTHILNLLFDAISYDQKKPGELTLLPVSEEQRLLYEFNDTVANYPRDKCVHQLFEEQAERTPEKTAVIACDRTLTYWELNEQANRIAHGLIAAGVKPGDIVAFALSRNSRLIPTMFGILKAGAAYLPIDPEYPQERIDFMLKDSGARAFVTERELPGLLENNSAENPRVAVSGESLCYCIYTSGSAGKPKSVSIIHQNIANFCCNDNTNLHNSIKKLCDCVIASNNIVFDITVQEIHLPLLNGKAVFLTKASTIITPQEIAAVTSLYDNLALITTPTKMTMFLAEDKMIPVLQKCQTIMVGAESFSPALYQKLKGSTGAEIFNGYGPTETTCGSCYQRVISSDDITIGRPIANTQIYIVDKYLQPVPIGVTGELCIAGDGVGAGYLNRPELTAEKFIENPFGKGKLYKTGDLAYWREDGNIVYVGRNDFQVKIRGMRIELGEIENTISSVQGISQAVVIVRKDGTGRQLICAFYTETEPVKLEHIKVALRERLPRYMTPHIFTRLETMLLTASGKVNRNAMPEVDLSGIRTTTEYVPPVGETEKRLAALIEQVLNYSPVGRDNDFFDLGGDSLKAIELLSKAHSDGIYFPLQSLFDHSTVRSLCEDMERGDRASVSYAVEDFTAINKLLERNRLEKAVIPAKQDVSNILLAGATGFLGAHILADFLEHDDGDAYCLVRGEDQASGEKRLSDLLDFYFDGKFTSLLGRRIQVVCGDLQKENLGLGEQEYRELAGKAQTVINAAASVKHYGSYQYFYEVNVESTQRLIDFCRSAGAKLIHISTLSVSGNGFDTFDGFVSETEKHFYESSLYIGQPLGNVYARSKFEAEKAVLEAMESGLRANIMRMGNLTNRASDGRFQINHQTNAAAQRIKGILELGMVPDYLIDENMYVEFTPIDEAAAAIMTVARHFSMEQTVFHINSTKVVSLDRLIKLFTRLGYPVRVASGAEFTQALRQTAKQAGTEYIFETFINDLDEQDRLNYDSNIRIENQFTEKYLSSIGFHWGDVGLDYLRKYVEYFEEIKWIRKN